jgi:shikimate dehydrogenase
MKTVEIRGSTQVAAIVGDPIEHSLSPLIHNAWLRAAKIDGVYIPLSPKDVGNRFESLIEGFRGGVINGLNVTLPYKARALDICDEVSSAGRDAGAVNVLLFPSNGRIVGDNTDGSGLLGAFAAQAPEFSLKEGPAVILGAGGAARGAAAALIAAGAPSVRLVNRTRSRADAIADILGPKISTYDFISINKAFDGAITLINATSLGLNGKSNLDINLNCLPKKAIVMDMVYRPLYTPLLISAQNSGRSIIDGLEMLIQQAAPSFEAFFGCPPPTTFDVRNMALKTLGNTV